MLEVAAAAALMLRDDGTDSAASLVDAAIEAPFILASTTARPGCAGPSECRCPARPSRSMSCKPKPQL